MIETIKDDEGKVIAYATMFHLNKYLQYDPTFTDLDVAYIDSFWKHPSCKLIVKDCIKIMVNNHMNKHPELNKAHFNRHHEDGRKSSKFHWYTKEQMMKVSGKNG